MAEAPQYMDFGKLMKDFDPSKFVEQFTEMVKGYKVPGVEIDQLIASQRKNVEALASANRVAFEGIQAVAKRQAEILQETMNEAQKAVDAVTKAGSPQDAAAKQAEVAKDAFEKALGHMRELAEMVTKANHEVTNTISTRVSESLDEIKEVALKSKT